MLLSIKPIRLTWAILKLALTNICQVQSGWTALMCAVDESEELLLEAGANTGTNGEDVVRDTLF
jgi:hypothetical protein